MDKTLAVYEYDHFTDNLTPKGTVKVFVKPGTTIAKDKVRDQIQRFYPDSRIPWRKISLMELDREVITKPMPINKPRRNPKYKKKLICFRLSKEALDIIKSLAKKQGVPYVQVLENWAFNYGGINENR